MDQTKENVKKVVTLVKKSATLIIAIVSIILIITIIISVVLYKKHKYKQARPVFLTTPTSGKDSLTLSPEYIKPLGSIYTFTFHFFIYIQDFDYRYGSYKEVFSKGEPDYACPAFYLAPKINKGIVKIFTGKGMKTYVIPDIEIKKWCHITIAVKDGEADIYYQGKLVLTGILGDFCKINGDPITIGRDGGFYGLIYNLSYTPDFLSPLEVSKLAKKHPPTNSKYFIENK